MGPDFSWALRATKPKTEIPSYEVLKPLHEHNLSNILGFFRLSAMIFIGLTYKEVWYGHKHI